LATRCLQKFGVKWKRNGKQLRSDPSDHRTLARVIGGDVAAKNRGPIAAITGLQGIPESIDPPNNNEYERTQEWTSIDQAVAALLPFVDKTTAASHGFDTTKVLEFQPFTPVAPNPLGDFIGLVFFARTCPILQLLTS
jgi:hypothetical protein